jgi:hypothetical protein
MSFHGWLQHLHSALALGRVRGHDKRRGSLRAATRRPYFECLEDRSMLSFSPAASFPVDLNPQAMVAGDFNKDGYLDLATANGGNTTVSVLLGDGQGGFGAAINTDAGYPGYTTINRLAVRDFDGDGNLDLAVASGYVGWEDFYSQLNFLYGNGNGTFQASGAIDIAASFGSPPLIAAYDDELVVLSDSGIAVVQVWVVNGNASFPIGDGYPIGNTAYTLAVGDLNGDGDTDVVAGGIALLGDGYGSGSFHSPTSDPYGGAFSTGGAVAIADFTGDGIPDLVAAGRTVDILVGHGDGTFDSPISYSANGSMHAGVAVADFNGDGKLDAVTSDSDTGTVSLLLGNGNGALTYAAAYPVGSSPSPVVVGDFNRDGWLDLATAEAGDTVSVLINDKSWPYLPPLPPNVSVSDATVTEGNTGATNATFTVSLSKATNVDVTVHYETADASATAGSDYQAASGDVIIPAGQFSRTFTVAVKGDRLAEPNETFAVNLTGATNATIADGQGIGAIIDDEPRISISDVTKKEGKKNQTTLFTFTVTLSAAYDQAVTMSFRTADGTAKTSNSDYVAKSGTLTFKPGETTKTITIEVKGDSKKEANETFYLDLFGLSINALFTKNRGLGTILNDD